MVVTNLLGDAHPSKAQRGCGIQEDWAEVRTRLAQA
jgi:hypothetical protein